MSEREVIKMLDDLHRQKLHAESQADMLQEQINGGANICSSVFVKIQCIRFVRSADHNLFWGRTSQPGGRS